MVKPNVMILSMIFAHAASIAYPAEKLDRKIRFTSQPTAPAPPACNPKLLSKHKISGAKPGTPSEIENFLGHWCGAQSGTSYETAITEISLVSQGGFKDLPVARFARALNGKVLRDGYGWFFFDTQLKRYVLHTGTTAIWLNSTNDMMEIQLVKSRGGAGDRNIRQKTGGVTLRYRK